VIARKGEIKEHHFAHANNKDSCIINPESLLHKYAKEVIIEAMELTLPSIPSLKVPEAKWKFQKIVPEYNLGKIRPDLVAYSGDTPIFIEIAVTHFIDQEKLKTIEYMGIRTIEIDLSDLLVKNIKIPSDDVKKIILDSLNNKRWVYPETYNSQNPISNITPSTWEDYQFTVDGIWVRARKFSGGMLSVSCTYNPQIIGMLKQWRNEGGGKYDQKYKSWNYFQPFSETVLKRLSEMHSL
jgi:hypothetical protein